MSYRSSVVRALGMAAALLSCANAAAQEDKRMYVAPQIAFTLADDARGTKDGLGMNLALGRRFASGLNLELTGFFTQMDSDVAGFDQATLYGFGVGGMLFPMTSQRNFYVLAAVHHGFVEDHPGTRVTDYEGTVFDSGLGYLMPLDLGDWGLAPGTALRAEARYRMDQHRERGAGIPGEKEYYDGVFSVGLQIPLGNLPEPPAEQDFDTQVVPAATGDADGDGVPDEQDRCPDTPAGATVGPDGCELDSDGDGVPDRLDQCPATPAGTSVNNSGCALDGAAVTTEGTCRQPAPGEPITLEGCASGDAIVLRGVNFDFNSARLTANAKVILDQVADALVAATNIVVEVGGHTDAIGSDAYNQSLSQKRAMAVYDYLVSRGVERDRLTHKGYGESVPIATNDTEDGRELNRRVELRVLGE